MILSDIISVLKEAKSIVILPHISVDGDGLGSGIALGLALTKINKTVEIYIEEEVPYTYKFLPDQQMVHLYEGINLKFDVAIAVDSGDIGRLGKRLEIFNNANTTINIDHHQTNSLFASYNYVQTLSSSVGEIIYQLIKMMGLDLDKDIATCLYVAITTDTGGFRFSNTTAITHQITADLINNGVDVAEISKQVFDSVSLAKVKLIALAINSLELFEDNKVAFLAITEDMLKSVDANEEDCEGIVNIGRNIRGVEVAVLFKQKGENEIKVNLRSNYYVDVSAIASQHSGGGHKRAAGCTINGEMDAAKEIILSDLRKALELWMEY